MALVRRTLPGSGQATPANLQRLPGGGNNRLFRLELPGGTVVLKRYFRHPGDPRDRLDSEFRFSQFLWRRGLRSLPEPLYRDDETGTGFYRHVQGTAPSQVADRQLQEAVSFLEQANEGRLEPEALALPYASEACFTLQQHLDLVGNRVRRLIEIPQATGTAAEAASLVKERLLPAWEAVLGDCLRLAAEGGVDPLAPLQYDDRVLSPSDFGFHNALDTGHGLIFHDFEYAGWDDPAKTACDFFCQVAVPVPLRHWGEASVAWARLTRAPEQTLRRMQLLLPAYRIKWVCIVLNHFLAVDGERRRFAKGDPELHLAEQLNLAHCLLSSMNA